MLAATLALLLAGAAPPATLTEIERASRAFDRAQQFGDRAALERFLAPDFMFVRGTGEVTGRAAFLATFGGAIRFEPFEIKGREVIGLGADAGIVAAEGTMRGTNNGVRFVQRFRFSDTFLRRNGRWQVIHVQVTPLPAPAD